MGLLTLLLLNLSFNAYAEGHGGGTGDGFPPDNGVEKTLHREVPAKAELESILSALSLEFPTLGRRLGSLIQRFESDSQYAILHVHASYPPAMADSQRTDTQDDAGIPRGARIIFFNEFLQEQPKRQAEVMLHEFVHLLITGSDEPATVTATQSLLKLAAGDLTEAPLLADRLEHSTRFVSSPGPLQREFYAVLRTYSNALSGAACSDIRWKKLGTGPSVPHAPARFADRLGHDAFFALYREHCLASHTEGRMILQGITESPAWHASLLQGLLGLWPNAPLVLTLSPSEDLVQTSYLSKLPAAIAKTQGRISIATLDRWIPGYSAWKKIQAKWFPAGTDLRQTYSAGNVARFPLQWISGLSPRSPIPLDFRSWRNGAWPVSLEAGSEATGSCKASSALWDCTYRVSGWFRTKTEQRRWPLTVEWAMRSFIHATPVAYSSWPSLVLE